MWNKNTPNLSKRLGFTTKMSLGGKGIDTVQGCVSLLMIPKG